MSCLCHSFLQNHLLILWIQQYNQGTLVCLSKFPRRTTKIHHRSPRNHIPHRRIHSSRLSTQSRLIPSHIQLRHHLLAHVLVLLFHPIPTHGLPRKLYRTYSRILQYLSRIDSLSLFTHVSWGRNRLSQSTGAIVGSV